MICASVVVDVNTVVIDVILIVPLSLEVCFTPLLMSDGDDVSRNKIACVKETNAICCCAYYP